MLTNYFKIAWRTLLKHKMFSMINLSGLTLGTAVCLYILLYVQEHHSYDRHHHEPGNLFRVTTDLELPGDNIGPMATSSPPVAFAMVMDFPEVATAGRICRLPGQDKVLFKIGDQSFYEDKGCYADSTIFGILDYHFLSGDGQHALDQPFSVVISEHLAQKYFNTTAATGNLIEIDGEQFKVTGVFNHSLGNTHVKTDYFVAMYSGGMGNFIRSDDSWAGNNFLYSYVRLRPGADPAALEAKLPDFLQKHGADQLRQLNMKKALHLQPVTAIHTDPSFRHEMRPVISERLLGVLLLVAGFIQLVACINFMNLTTARSVRRAREVGVRKAVGANRGALIGQFLGESMLLSAIAVLCTIPVLILLLPYLNQLTSTDVRLDLMHNGPALGMLGALMLGTGLIAGVYPAFYLSSFNPLLILRGLGSVKSSSSAIWVRKGLVISQFAIASALIIGAFVIQLQVDYILHKDLGFEKKQKLVFPFRDQQSINQIAVFRDEISRLPEVRGASCMAVCPGQMVFNDMGLYKEGGDMSTATHVRFTFVDENYLNTLKIKLLQGRFLTPTDTSSRRGVANVVVNEELLKQLQMNPADATGRYLRREFRGEKYEFNIVGVMQDFAYQDLADKMEPFMVIYGPPTELNHVVADVAAPQYDDFVQKAGQIWSRLIPGIPFEYSFLDDDIQNLYKAEQTLSQIFSAAMLIAILISCLGLFGLATFTAEQRNKEIGIRKVLGASIAGITGLLAADFLKLVVIAFFLATPLSWYFMNQWLKDFAHHIDLQWWIFAVAGFGAVFIAGITVSFQSIRAAMMNPVKALKTE